MEPTTTNHGEAARELMAAHPGLTAVEANAAAWRTGRGLLERAIRERLAFAFETTLGAATRFHAFSTGQREAGSEIRIWYVGLESPELHRSKRVARPRVRRGGHSIPEEVVRRRYEHSRLNLIQLLPFLAALRVYDNSAPADPEDGELPTPRLLLHLEGGRIVGPENLAQTPDWAKPIVAAAIQIDRSPSNPRP